MSCGSAGRQEFNPESLHCANSQHRAVADSDRWVVTNCDISSSNSLSLSLANRKMVVQALAGAIDVVADDVTVSPHVTCVLLVLLRS